MYLEANPAEVVQHDGSDERGSDTDSRKDTRAHFLREGDSGQCGGDAKESSRPGPSRRLGKLAIARPGIANYKLNEQDAKTRRIDDNRRK